MPVETEPTVEEINFQAPKETEGYGRELDEDFVRDMEDLFKNLPRLKALVYNITDARRNGMYHENRNESRAQVEQAIRISLEDRKFSKKEIDILFPVYLKEVEDLLDRAQEHNEKS